MSHKQKGSDAERELVEMLQQAGYASVRIAGSGCSKFPCPDVLASNGSRVLAIECKSTKKHRQYFRKAQIKELLEFSNMFAATPMCAIKFSTSWHFIEPHKLRDSGKMHGTDRKHVLDEGCALY
tara:strand:- start:46 stop:417 length:372 start_codon:yes stop_codon:yes gene_type:complete